MKYAIVTGASKGLGAAIAQKMLAENVNVIAVSRTENQELKQAAAATESSYQFYSCNLTSPSEINSVFEKITGTIFNEHTEEIHLINNAGVIEPIETVGKLDEASVLQSIQVNLTAPVLINNLILDKAEPGDIPVIITNVTSGAAERAVHGWSMYCSTKAAINRFTQTAALELANRKSIHKIIAFSPGIMDTEMQATIRTSTEEAFVEIDKFRGFKEKNLLRSPQTVANVLVKLVTKDTLTNGKIYYVNDLL